MPYSLAELPLLLILPVLLAASAFFSGCETALFGLTAHQRHRMTARGGMIGGALKGLLENQRTLLVTLMIGNMVANTTYFVITSALLFRLEGASAMTVAIVSVAPLAAVIMFGEVAPKLIANTAREKWVLATAVPLYTLHRVASPFASGLSRWVIEPLGRVFAPPSGPGQLETDELEALLDMSQNRGVIRTDEQQLLREVLLLGQRKVKDVMVPRVDIVAIDINDKPEVLESMIRATGLTKYVAVDGDIDHIQGVIYARQFWLARRRGRGDLKRLVRQVRFVPEILRVDRLLEDFRRTGTHLAIAVDEYGGTAGLVTLKDLVERMVGDLDMDGVVGDTADWAVQQIAPGEWRVSGRLSVRDWTEAFGEHTLPPRVSTVGGLVTALLGRMAEPGDRVMLANLELEAEQVEKGRVESVRLRLKGAHAPGATAGERA